jgi:hypothetical protein
MDNFFVNIIILPKLNYYLAIVGYFILGYFHNSNLFLAIINYSNIGFFCNFKQFKTIWP